MLLVVLLLLPVVVVVVLLLLLLLLPLLWLPLTFLLQGHQQRQGEHQLRLPALRPAQGPAQVLPQDRIQDGRQVLPPERLHRLPVRYRYGCRYSLALSPTASRL